jgi:KaiC/GvpD/RAD55 family RecA-like ATPase
MALINLTFEDLPKKSLLLAEEELGDVKRVFSQKIAAEAIKAGKDVVYVTPKSKEDIDSQVALYGIAGNDKLKVIEKFTDGSKLQTVCGGDLCIIEKFTLMNISTDINHLVYILNSLADISRTKNIVFLLTSDMGVMTERSEKILRAMVEGVIQFSIVYEENKITRYMSIPKLNGAAPVDRKIPFALGENGIVIDTRERFA